MRLTFHILVALLGTIACNVISNHDYRLTRPLAVGDSISAIGNFKAGDFSKARFSVCIMDDKDQYIFLVEFRPGNNALVLNNMVKGKGWQIEVRPPFKTADHFQAGHAFYVTIVVQPKHYNLYFSGKKVGEFPHRMPFESATKVKLFNGPPVAEWEWVSPLPSIGYNHVVSNHQYRLQRPLRLGDAVEAIGHFKAGDYSKIKPRFSMSLMDDKNQYVLLVEVRMETNVLLFNNLISGKGWQHEIRPKFNAADHFHDGKTFHVKAVVNKDGYEIFINDKMVGKFPHRMPFTSATKLKVIDAPPVAIWQQLVPTMPLAYGRIVSGHGYRFKRPLIAGDLITATGSYLGGTAGVRFFMSLKDDKGQHILLVEFRLYNNVVLFNNYVTGKGWGTEVRPHFKMSDYFQAGKPFTVTVSVLPSEYVILINGKHVGNFPHRLPFGSATNVVLSNGATGIKWFALRYSCLQY